MKKLAIVSSHPIQYNAPWFSLLNERCNNQPEIKVFYTWSQLEKEKKFDPGFGKAVDWDIPLLEGYNYCFVKNTSVKPGTHHFNGLVNPTLINEIESWNADAVLVFGWAFRSHLACIKHFHKKIPVLFRGDSTLLDEQKGIKRILRRFFLRWVYRHIDYALFTGIQNKKYFLAHGVTENKLLYAPHAVDNNRFFDADGKYRAMAKQLRIQLALKEDDVVILFAGKLEPKKDPLLLIKIFKKIKHPHLKILFIGSGVLENEIKAAAAQDERILLLGFQNQQQMPVMYRLADIFVLPSSGPGETWGLALNEAMACGKPVVASDRVGGAVDLIQNGENGLIFKAGSTEEMEFFFNEALLDKRIIQKMGNRSEAKIIAYSFESIVSPIVNLAGVYKES